MSRTISFRAGLFAVGAAALAVRIAYLLLLERRGLFFGLFLDSKHYATQAAQIRAGQGIGAHPYQFSPLYPYFLAIFTSAAGELNVRLVQVVQMVFGAGTAVLTALIGRGLSGSAAGIIGGLVVAVYGPFIHTDSLILVTALQTFFLTLALWLVARCSRSDVGASWLAVGVALGVASALRPTALALVAVVAAVLLVRRRTKPALLVLAGSVLLVAPFTARNVVQSGEWVLLSVNGGVNFWVGNGTGANGLYRLPPGTDFMNDPLSKHGAERATGRPMTHREASSWWFNRASAEIREAPGRWLGLLLGKGLYFLHPTEISQLGSAFDWYRDRAWPLRFPLDARWIFILALLLPFVWRGEPARMLPAAGFVVIYAAAICLFFVTDRYRSPIMPAVIVLAASTVVGVSRLWRSGGLRHHPVRAALPIAGVLVLGVASHLLYASPRALFYVSTITSQEERHRGMALYEAGRFDEAIAAYHAALAIEESPITRNNLANALTRAGRAEEAAAEYERALELHPGFALSWYNYGILLHSVLGRPARAEEAFRNAIRHAPRTPDAHYKLGRLYLDEERPEEAVRALERCIELAPAGSPLFDRARRFLEEARARAGPVSGRYPGHGDRRLIAG